MSYDEGLAERLYELFEGRIDYSDKRMFGGLGFMVHGHMVVGIIKEELLVRVGKEGWAEARTLPGAREMDFTGRPMKTMVFVDQSALDSDEALAAWVQRGLDFVLTLPPK